MKKIKKGQPLEELVKGSLEYTMNLLTEAFRAQFPYVENGLNYWISETFSDYVTVRSYSDPNLKVDEYYKVPFTQNGEEFAFAPKDTWEVVELAYQPKTIITESLKKEGQRLEETISPAQVELLEAKDENKQTRRIRINDLMVADEVNGNKRLYSQPVIEAMVEDWKPYLRESRGQGRLMILTGEVEHPSDKGKKRPEFLETVVRWDNLDWDGKRLNIEGDLILTSKGRDVEILMEAGVKPGGSIRGIGESRIKKVDGQKIEEVLWASMNAADLVGDPSFKNAAALQESINETGDEEMTLEELKKLLAEQPELFGKGFTEAQLTEMSDKQLKKIEESIREKLGIDAEADLGKALDETIKNAAEFKKMQAKQAIDEAVKEATKDLKFGEKLNKEFTEALDEQDFATVDEVKKFAETQSKLFNKLASAGVLKDMGYMEGKVIGVRGPVLESETGTPEFARASFQLTESLSRVNMSDIRDWNKPVSLNEKFTKQLLDSFDKKFQGQLMAESKVFEEAETTSDLNLPYSVSRALIGEAFPNLVASGIFDVGIMNNSPDLLYFETFAGETGYTNTVTDEVVTGGAEGVWYALDHGRITPGTVVVTSNPAGTTYVEGTDFKIDYAAGRIWFLTDGDIGANDVLVDYGYTAAREGEMAVIQRGKITLSSMTITAAADRLADQISREAVVFSRSQMGLDVVARTMSNLVRQLRIKIDQGLIYAAWSAVKGVASNSGGTWTIGTTDADYAELVRLIGATKLLVRNRYYAPTFVLMSATNAEYLTNWSGFKRDGFPDAVLSAAGFVGRLKGLPVFESTEMPDTDIIVGNRELVAHRVFQPALINGPYHTQDVSTGKLIAAQQYYVEEFNNTETPVEEKGAYLTVASGS